MKLVEMSQVPLAVLPLAQLKAHLRLGTGFSEDGLQDEVLESFMRAALGAIEARTGKILISRRFSLSLRSWGRGGVCVLPLAPVTAVASLGIVGATDTLRLIGPERYLLEDGDQRAVLRGRSALPAIPEGGRAVLELQAGMAAGFGDLPADLVQAVLLLAAHYYEYRHETALGPGCMPFGVSTLIERYRVVRLGLGALA